MVNLILENINNIFLLLLLISAFIILFSKDYLLIIPMMGVFSLVITMIYLVLGAADVAITETAVGGCFSTILLFIAYKNNKERETYDFKLIHIIPLIIIVFAALIFCLSLPEFGNSTNQIHHHISNYYLENTKKDIGIDSVTSAILASYRGFDTLGETTVIMLACLGVLNIVKKS